MFIMQQLRMQEVLRDSKFLLRHQEGSRPIVKETLAYAGVELIVRFVYRTAFLQIAIYIFVLFMEAKV